MSVRSSSPIHDPTVTPSGRHFPAARTAAAWKRPTVACVHPLPDNLAYLPGADAFVGDVPEEVDYDLVVAIDMVTLSVPGVSTGRAGSDRSHCS